MSGSNSPEINRPGSLLRRGEFYSPVESRLSTDAVLLSELRQPCPRKVPRHEHELAYVTVVLQGDYLEGDRGKLEDLRPLTATFNPAGVQHETVIGPSGASLFTIELRDQRLKDLGVRLPAQTKFDRGSGAMLLPGLRMYLALKTQTSDAVLLESDVLELLAAIAGFSSGEKTAPEWLGRVKERMHGEFSNKIRMCDLADEAWVHPSGASVSPDREIDARRAPAAVEGACSLSQAARSGVSSGRDCDGVRLRRSKPPHPHFQEVYEDYARTIQTNPPLALKALTLPEK